MSNLASVIMEGAQVSGTIETQYDFTDSAVAESSYLDSAVATLYTDIMEADQEYMVSDVVGAATIIRESRLGNNIDRVAVTEGVIANGIEKLKNAFKKFWAKLKAFVKKVLDWFKAMFSNAEDFAKNYGDAVLQKARTAKGFTYSGYKYTIDAGTAAAKSIIEKFESHIETVLDKAGVGMDNNYKDNLLWALNVNFKAEDAPSTSDIIDDAIGKLSEVNASNVTELRTELTNLFRDGDDKKHDITDFSDNSVDFMLKHLKGQNKTISNINKRQNDFEKGLNKTIKELDKFKAKDGVEGGENQVSHASFISSVISGKLNAMKVVFDVEVNMIKAATSDFLGTLKKFYSYRAAKESSIAGVYDLDAYATMESSLLVMEGESKSDEPEGDVEDGDNEVATESAVASILEQAAQYL